MRGERSDYDRWAAMGCTGWGYDDIFPYFLKAEQFHGTPMQSHGRHGPLSVSPIQGPQPVGQYVIDAFVAAGIPLNEDSCDGSQSGVYRIFATQKNGQRCTAARAYLEPARQRANLPVLTHAPVDKIMAEGSRAIGAAAPLSGQKRIFRTARKVLL